MSHPMLTTVIRATEKLTGRRRLAQFARLLTNEVRLDTANEIDHNGERDVQRAVNAFVEPVVLDVGAHFGEWSLALLEVSVGSPIIHSFEPSANSHRRAEEELGDRATVHRLALSDRTGTADLHVVHDGAGTNSLASFADHEGFDSLATEPVAVDTVDEVLARLGVTRVTLLKIDAEGHDMAVIRGAERSLSARAIDLMQFEYNWRWIASRQYLLDAFDLLTGRGYLVGKVTRRGIELYDGWHPELEKFTEANYLALLPQHRHLFDILEWWEPQRQS